MALKIRLRQQGRNNRQFYRLVVADVRSPRDGKYVEQLGWYNPFESEQDKSISVKADRIQHWLDTGAELSDRARNLLAKVAPSLLRSQTEKTLANRAKAASKRKARAQKAGARTEG
jgi:small subunit ribosomal protein S16